MDAKYYPRDVKKRKEQEFLSLEQGEMSALEYASKLNELSCCAPKKVAI